MIIILIVLTAIMIKEIIAYKTIDKKLDRIRKELW